MKGWYVFQGDRILKTDLTGQNIGVKSDAVFMDMNFLYPLAMSNYSLLCGNYEWLNDPCALNFSDIATGEESGLQRCFSLLMFKYRRNFMAR